MFLLVRNINNACDWLNMFTKVSERLYLAFFVKMGRKTRAQQLRANDQRRSHRSKARQDVFISEYIQLKYFDVYSEAAKFYNALNMLYPAKYDLRKTEEYRDWKAAINGQTVKIRKLPMPEHLNIQTVSPQSPAQSETAPPQSSTQSETAPPQSPTQPETTPPQSPAQSETAPPQSPTQSETAPAQSPTQPETTPPQSPVQSETTPPQSPAEEEKELLVYNDNLQLKIPLFQYNPKTPRPTVTTETLETITEQIVDEGTIQPTILDELMPGMLEQIITELRQEPELLDIFTDIEQQVEFEQLGMDIDICEYDILENELLEW